MTPLRPAPRIATATALAYVVAGVSEAHALPTTELLSESLTGVGNVTGVAAAVADAVFGIATIGLGGGDVHGAACPALRGIGFAFLGLAALVVIALARLRLGIEQRRLDLARRMVEQGQAPPSELLLGSARNDLRRGIVLMFAGAGLLATAVVTGNHALLSGGLVPGFIGVGYLVSHRIASRRRDA